MTTDAPRRYRARKVKPGQLVMYYGKLPGDSPDVVYAWGGDGAGKRHGNLLSWLMGGPRIELLFGEDREKAHRDWRHGRSILEELDAAGFDLTTLRFSIEIKRPMEPQQ